MRVPTIHLPSEVDDQVGELPVWLDLLFVWARHPVIQHRRHRRGDRDSILSGRATCGLNLSLQGGNSIHRVVLKVRTNGAFLPAYFEHFFSDFTSLPAKTAD